MLSRIKSVLGVVSSWLIRLLTSKKFFVAVLVLAAIQGLWYAASFQPHLFDEGRHIQFIQLYSSNPDPFIESQTEAMDKLGQVSREPSYFYYYVMSLVLDLFKLFTSNEAVQILLLRFINIGLFILSLVLFRRLFIISGISSAVVNIALLMFVLTPAVAPLAGAVSYDVGVLPLIVLMFFFTVKVIKSKDISLKSLLLFYSIASIASVVKYTSLPVAVVCTLVVLSYVFKKAKGSPGSYVKNKVREFNHNSLWLRVLVVAIALLGTALAVERPIANVLIYKNISPTCFQTLPQNSAQSRCVANYTYKRNADFLAVKPIDFKPINPVVYSFNTWSMGMISTTTQQYPGKPPLSTMTYVYYLILIGGAITILIAIRGIIARNKIIIFYVVLAILYTATVFYSNYKGYADLGQPVAISARYLIPIIPIFFVLLILSGRELTRRKFHSFAALLIIPYVVLMTQGGGIVTFLISAERHDYWNNEIIKDVNIEVRSVLRDVTKD